MTITFAIALTVVLTLSSVYLIRQWWTGELRDERPHDVPGDFDLLNDGGMCEVCGESYPCITIREIMAK